MSTDSTSPGAIPGDSTDFHTALKEAVKEALHDLLSASMRPAVIASDSGVSSVTYETMSNGTTKVMWRVYHEDPIEAQRLARMLYEEDINYWHGHSATNIVPPKR